MKKLTLRYTVQQTTYWGTSACVVGFATAYLLGRGLPASQVGTVMALAGLFSCISQPLLAARADRAQGGALNRMLALLCAIAIGCFGLQFLCPGGGLLTGVLYMAGVWAFDTMLPLMNAVSVSYNRAGFFINYGVARGIGALVHALTALAMGYVMEGLGSFWMPVAALVCLGASLITAAGYPKLAPCAVTAEKAAPGCGVWEFIRRYKRYCLSLLGVLFLGMFHAMTESYMIAIMQRLGGGSAQVGVALFISAAAAVPAMLCFKRIRGRVSDSALMKLAACSFLLKAVAFYFAKSVAAVYGAQLFQLTSYAILCTALIYYAEESVAPGDMVKGQAFATAAYALGCAAGNFCGGLLLERLGVESLILAGIAMAGAGTVILFLTVKKTGAKSSAP